MATQDDVFLYGEGDAWFERNRATVGGARTTDWPMRLLAMLDEPLCIGSAIELGCSDGLRLLALRETLGGDVRLAGVDASAEAVRSGRERFGLDLRQGLLSNVPLDEPADLVIVFSVLHWVDRATLARSVAEIDRLVSDGGLLVLGDFLPDFPQRRRYHHLPDQSVFTWKQDYAKLFEALGTYREIIRVTYDCGTPSLSVGPTASGSRACCSLLSKALRDYYAEAEA